MNNEVFAVRSWGPEKEDSVELTLFDFTEEFNKDHIDDTPEDVVDHCNHQYLMWLEYTTKSGTGVLGWHLFSTKEEVAQRGNPEWLLAKVANAEAAALRDEIRKAAGELSTLLPTEEELGW